MKPNRAKNATATDALAALKRALRNTPTSSIGSSRCSSQAMKLASRTNARRKPPSVTGAVQPWRGASITVYTRVDTPAMDTMRPTGSKRPARVSREVGSSTRPAISATATTGTLTKNAEPHQKCSSSQPPVTGPRATAMPDAPAHRPMALARSAGSVKTLARRRGPEGRDRGRASAPRYSPSQPGSPLPRSSP
jgi:hypothetical protein